MLTPLNKLIKVHISELRHGDTVYTNGEIRTVSRNHIGNSFSGWTYNGDPHRETKGMVDVVLFPKWLKGEIIYYAKQF